MFKCFLSVGKYVTNVPFYAKFPQATHHDESLKYMILSSALCVHVCTCVCVMTRGMDQRQRPPLLCGNQWDWILKVFSGASVLLVNTALCHKCILYTHIAHTHTPTHTLPVHCPKPDLPCPSSCQHAPHNISCSSSLRLNLPHFPLFHILHLSASPRLTSALNTVALVSLSESLCEFKTRCCLTANIWKRETISTIQKHDVTVFSHFGNTIPANWCITP